MNCTRLAVIFGALALLAKRATGGAPMPQDEPTSRSDIRALITLESKRVGLEPAIALATARAESNFKADAEGDLGWHKRPDRFDRVVPRDNPYRNQRELWHSYGVFQLLAPYHVMDGEHPRVLLDPQVNVKRGVAFLRRLSLRHNGDPDAIRLAYTGASRLSPDVQRPILAKWHRALAAERGVG